MIEVVAAGSLPSLLARLAQSLAAGEVDPFVPTRVVVPSHPVRAWVQLALARRLGIVCNLQISFLDSFFASLVPAARSDLRLLERDLLQSAVLKALEEPTLMGHPNCAGLRAYLERSGLGAPAQRRCQLASAVANLFGSYALARPEFFESWSGEDLVLPASAELADAERWQAEVWRRVFGSAREVQTGTEEPRTHVDVARLFEAVSLGECEVPACVHLFGFATFAKGYQDLLVRLSERCEVHLYVLSTSIGDPQPPGSRSLAGMWGLPGREFRQGWEGLALERPADVSLASLASEAKPQSVLGSLQAALAGQASVSWPTEPDASLQLLACPSRGREVEVVAGKIWQLVRESAAGPSPLRFDEIAVAVVDPLWDAYRNRIRPTFREAHRIPLSLLNQPAVGENRVAEAARLLIDLPLGDFARDDLLRFLIHPAVQANLPEADPQQWLTWCEELTVLRGVDRADVAETYVTRDLYTFGQGARRLALGAFLEGGGETPAPILTLDGQPYLSHALSPGQQGSAAQFLLLVRSLTGDLRFARDAQLSLTEWSIFLRRLLTTYLDPEGNGPQLLGRLVGKLARLEALDVDGRAVSFRVAHDFASRGFGSLRQTRSQPLCEGVVVGPLRALAGLPFRALFVLGLEERAFPAQAWNDSLDLRQTARQAGDVSPRERDRFAFLLALSAATEQATLSYVCRDDTTGEGLAPSSVVRQLEAELRVGLSSQAFAGLWSRPPLRRYAPSAFPHPLGTRGEASAEALAEGRREAQARALKASLQEVVPSGAVWPDPADLTSRLAPEARALLDPLVGLCRPAASSTLGTEADLRLPLATLYEFLSSPLQAWGKRRLGFRDGDDSDLLAQEDEPFSTSVMDATVLLRAAFYDALAAVPSGDSLKDAPLEAAYDARVLRAELEGRLPTGVFLRVERRLHLGVLESWRRNVTRHFDDATVRALAVHRFGQATRRGRSDVLAGPLEVEVDLGTPAEPRPVRVRLHGSTLPVLPGHGGTLQLVLAKQASQRHVLRGFLDHVVLAATGHGCEGPYQAVVSPRGWANLEHPKHYRGFRAFTRDEARDYLQLLVHQFLSGPHEVLFPIDVTGPYVEQWHREGAAPGELAERIQASRDDGWRQDSDDYGPVPQPGRFSPPADADALAWARLSPLVTRRVEPEEVSS